MHPRTGRNQSALRGPSYKLATSVRARAYVFSDSSHLRWCHDTLAANLCTRPRLWLSMLLGKQQQRRQRTHRVLDSLVSMLRSSPCFSRDIVSISHSDRVLGVVPCHSCASASDASAGPCDPCCTGFVGNVAYRVAELPFRIADDDKLVGMPLHAKSDTQGKDAS
jgi:hypothetical protein